MNRMEHHSVEGLIKKQKKINSKKFGDKPRVEGILKHIGKEVEEVRYSPYDLYEWIDILILAVDGAWRQGYTPSEIAIAWKQKLDIIDGRIYEEPVDETIPAEKVK